MVRIRRSLSRRALITSGGSLGLGALAVGGLAAADGYVASPALTIVGERTAQFTLLRTEDAKIGLLFGAPADNVLAVIPSMLGWTSPRLDVLATSPATLTDSTNQWLARQTCVRSLLILGPVKSNQMPAVPAGVQARVLDAAATIRLTSELAVDLLPSFSFATTLDSTSQTAALALVRTGSQVVALTDDATALQQQPWRGDLTLLVVPAGDVRPIVASARPRAVAINSGGDLGERIVPSDFASSIDPLAVVPVFLKEPAVVELGYNELRLPGWTKIISPGARS